MMPTKTPDISPAQVLAVIGSVLAELVNAQLIDGHTEHLIVGLAGVIVPAAWMIADAIIRHGRSRALANVVPPTAPPPPSAPSA